MVSIDDRLDETLAGSGDWWRRPRWLILPVTLPLFLVGGLAVGTLVNVALTGEGTGRQGGLLGPGSAAAAEQAGLVPAATCERMQHIVGTACSLKQRDHDASDIRSCIAHELKYTMWSVYGCQ
jgi:hypothetical protein